MTAASGGCGTSFHRSLCWGWSAPPPGSSPDCRRPRPSPTTGHTETCAHAFSSWFWSAARSERCHREGEFLSKKEDTLTCKCGPWSRYGPPRTPPATWRRAPCYRDPSAPWWAFPGSGTETKRERQARGHQRPEQQIWCTNTMELIFIKAFLVDHNFVAGKVTKGTVCNWPTSKISIDPLYWQSLLGFSLKQWFGLAV